MGNERRGWEEKDREEEGIVFLGHFSYCSFCNAVTFRGKRDRTVKAEEERSEFCERRGREEERREERMLQDAVVRTQRSRAGRIWGSVRGKGREKRERIHRCLRENE